MNNTKSIPCCLTLLETISLIILDSVVNFPGIFTGNVWEPMDGALIKSSESTSPFDTEQ